MFFAKRLTTMAIGVAILTPSVFCTNAAAQACSNPNFTAELQILKSREKELDEVSQRARQRARETEAVGRQFLAAVCPSQKEAMRARRARVEFEFANKDCFSESIRDLIDEGPEDLKLSEALLRDGCGY